MLSLLVDFPLAKGPGYNYFPNDVKIWLDTKPKTFDMVIIDFAATDVQITQNGHQCLGAAIGSDFFIKEFVLERVED